MTWIETKLLIREPVTLVFSFAFPVLVLVLLGGIFGGQRVSRQRLRGLKMMDWYVPSYIGLVIASNGTVSLPVHTLRPIASAACCAAIAPQACRSGLCSARSSWSAWAPA